MYKQAPIKQENISKGYYDNISIAKREFIQLGITPPDDGVLEDGDNWMKVNKKLSNAINDVKGVSYTTNYILLTVNLNERSNRADLIKENETWKYKAESTLSTFNFINKLATLNNVLPDPIYFKNSERDKIGEIDDDDVISSVLTFN